jgi:type III pantothenate kinase
VLLAIDAGNSFVKLARHDGAGWQPVQRVALDRFAEFAAALPAEPRPAAIVISNVAGETFRRPMLALLARWGRAAHWVTPQARAYGVSNAYAVPAQLGSDRWACLAAVRRQGLGDTIIASIGTAVTVDALDAEGEFRGGVILPGVALMQHSLWQRTAGIPPAEGRFERFPNSTADAVYTGALLAVAGTVERMAEALGGGTQTVLTGGDAKLIAPLLRPAPRLIENLVLEGLLVIAREEGML